MMEVTGEISDASSSEYSSEESVVEASSDESLDGSSSSSSSDSGSSDEGSGAVVGYAYEPEYSEAELAAIARPEPVFLESAEQEHDPCVCGKCPPSMPTDTEMICCQRTVGDCLSTSSKFRATSLSQDALEMFGRQVAWQEKNRAIYTTPAEKWGKKHLRFLAYQALFFELGLPAKSANQIDEWN